MSSTYLARDVASRMHHCASLVSREYGSGVMADLREIANADMTEQKTQFDARKLDILASFGYEPVESSKPFAYSDGVAIIPIHGLLINRLSWSYSFATGYNFIRSQRLAALADPDVKLIVYDVNSPGGIASGCAELAQEMHDSRGEKPSLAVVDARCYSAAYFLASAADRLVVTPSGGVGSIGVVAMHMDYSAALDAEGLKITFIMAGNEKVDGNPYERLSKRAQASIQRDVDYHYGLFVEAVARHRGLSEDDIRATEAASYLPPEALDLGLIDAIESPAEAVAKFFNEITSDADAGDETMTSTTAANTAVMTTPAVVSGPPALTAEDVATIAAKAATEAVSADRARSTAIRTCAEAKGRETLADHLALNTSMSADDAKAILAVSPVAAPESATALQTPNGFAAAMDLTANPNVGADAGSDAVAGGGAETPEVKSSRILASYVALTGRKVSPRQAA